MSTTLNADNLRITFVRNIVLETPFYGDNSAAYIRLLDGETILLEVTNEEFDEDPQAALAKLALGIGDNIPNAHTHLNQNTVSVLLDQGKLTIALDGSWLSIHEGPNLREEPTTWEISEFDGEEDPLTAFGAPLGCLATYQKSNLEEIDALHNKSGS